MNHKNLKDRTLFKRNYYAVSLKEGYVEKILSDKIKQIKETGEYEFTITYDYYDHKEILPCKIIVEEIDTHKRYFELT